MFPLLKKYQCVDVAGRVEVHRRLRTSAVPSRATIVKLKQGN